MKRMNTFIPNADLKKSVECLDTRRLFKQIVECKQLLLAINAKKKGEKYGWQNHACTKMWYQYPQSLRYYQLLCLNEWCKRRFEAFIDEAMLEFYEYEFKRENPIFIGNEAVHRSHRLNLLWKDYEHYSQYFIEPTPTSKPAYVWVNPAEFQEVLDVIE